MSSRSPSRSRRPSRSLSDAFGPMICDRCVVLVNRDTGAPMTVLLGGPVWREFAKCFARRFNQHARRRGHPWKAVILPSLDAAKPVAKPAVQPVAEPASDGLDMLIDKEPGISAAMAAGRRKGGVA